MKKRILHSRLNICLAIVILAVMGLFPIQSGAADMSYGDWELDGFFRNNTGFWTESWDYAPNNDPLATFRNWFRLNLNGSVTDNLKLKAEIQAIYEPEYHREKGAGIPANEYNSFDFRELRLDWKVGNGHNIRIGRQIVNWGESLSARVGDVINPQDHWFDLGFTNLEDSRMPIWMLRGMHQFYGIGTSLDWIFSPYNQVDRYRASRTLAWNPGKIDINGNWNGVGERRFCPYPETRIYKDDVGFLSPSQVFGTGLMPAFGMMENGVLWAPFNQVMYQPIGGGLYGVTGAPNITRSNYPDSNLDDARWGFKTSSTLYGVQTGVYFWRGHAFTPPVLWYKGSTPSGLGFDYHNFELEYTRQNTYGLYANKNFDFGVLRMDMAYKPEYDYQTDDISRYSQLVCQVDTLLFQLGFNKDFMMRRLNANQAFSLTAEYVGEYLLGETGGALLAFPWHEKKRQDSHTLMMSLGTNYNFGMYALDLTSLYNMGNNGLIQPSFTYNPDWMNRKWSFKLSYANVFGDHNYDLPYGILREKDLVVLTTQFSFP